MFMNNRTYLVAVQILFIIKVISQYQYSWNFRFSVLDTMQWINMKKLKFVIGAGALRTIQDLENDNNAWQELTGGDRSKLKNYFNVEFHPLLEDKNSLVLFLLPPPPLHLLLLGQGNKLWETLENICIQRFGKNIQNNPLMKFVKKKCSESSLSWKDLQWK